MNYLKPLEAKLKKLLPVNTYFTLDDGEQSHVVYPTNYINLVNDFISIEVGYIIYSNITEHEGIISNVAVLFELLTEYAYIIGDYAHINKIDDSYRLNYGGVDIEYNCRDFECINDLINYLKTY